MGREENPKGDFRREVEVFQTRMRAMKTSRDGMRILIIAPTPFFADRGCHVRILEEARALMALGRQVTICTYHNGRDINGIDARRIVKIPWYSKLSAGPSFHMPLPGCTPSLESHPRMPKTKTRHHTCTPS